MHDLYNLLHCSLQGFCYILDAAKQLLFLVLYINNWKVRKNMNADMKWLDNPEVFKVNQLEPHSDHCYYVFAYKSLITAACALGLSTSAQ